MQWRHVDSSDISFLIVGLMVRYTLGHEPIALKISLKVQWAYLFHQIGAIRASGK